MIDLSLGELRWRRLVCLSILIVGLAGIAKAEPATDHVITRIGTNRVSIVIAGGERIIKANGIPDHVPGNFPRPGNPNTISAQSYNLQVPTSPAAAANTTLAGHALFGVAINGVPFDPGTAEFWNNDRSSGWNYEANTGFLDLGLDQNNAHVQPTGAYHYHAMPKGLVARLMRKAGASVGSDNLVTVTGNMLLLGWAADGFPIYNNYSHSIPNDLKSALKKVHSSYRLKKGERPGGPGGKYDGSYTADFEYVKGSGDLDECNGGFGVTPDFPNGIYHYSITEEFPFIPRIWRGTPDPSFIKRGPGPGGRPPGKRPPGDGSNSSDRAANRFPENRRNEFPR